MSVWPPTNLGNSNSFRQSYVTGFLDVSGSTTLRNDVSMNSRLYVIGDASMGGNVFVGQTIYPVGGINQLSTSLPVMGTVPTDATIANRLFVLNDSSLNGRLFVGGDVSMNGTLITPNKAFINQEYLLGDSNNTSYNSKSSNYGGTNNAFFGFNCGAAITSGATNSGFGQNNTLLGLTSGSSNTAVGSGALQAVTTTSSNTAIGNGAGLSTTGSNNTFIGATANTTLATASNSTAIGYGASVTASNQVVLGTTSESVIIPNTITYVYASVPTFTSNQIGYSVTTTSNNSINFTNAGLMFCATSGLPIGVYIFAYQFSQNSGSQFQIALVNNASGTPAARTDIAPLMFGPTGSGTVAGAITYKSTSAANVFGICGFAFSGTNNAYVCQVQLTRIA